MKKSRLLIVDDESGVVDYLVEALTEAGYEAAGLTSPLRALERINAQSFDLVIADIEMPEMRGLDLLAAILAKKPDQLVLLITAFGSIDVAVQAVRAGACDFVAKPFKLAALLLVIERALRERKMRREIVRLRAKLPENKPGDLVANSKAMQHVLELGRRAANTDLAVLLTGESGTGKGALARFIHDNSPRRAGPFVQVNCATVPEALAESELFGAQKGAYTDAKADRPGLFVEADRGTLFLDEIAELSLEVQAKLLQVLESGLVRPLGKASQTPVNVRIMAATNRSLEDALKARSFRPDLYFRLNVVRLDLPPLRQRPEDLLALVDLFLSRASARSARPVLGISAEAMRLLLDHPWPGNVRELANAIERAVALTEHDTLLPEDLWPVHPPANGNEIVTDAAAHRLPLADVERAYIQKVLDSTGGNKVRAARILGIDRRTLHRKLAEPGNEVLGEEKEDDGS